MHDFNFSLFLWKLGFVSVFLFSALLWYHFAASVSIRKFVENVIHAWIMKNRICKNLPHNISFLVFWLIKFAFYNHLSTFLSNRVEKWARNVGDEIMLINGFKKVNIMMIEKLRQLKEKSRMTNQQISERSNIPESTVARIFSGKTPNPTIATVFLFWNNFL